jgi:predicted secreted protein
MRISLEEEAAKGCLAVSARKPVRRRSAIGALLSVPCFLAVLAIDGIRSAEAKSFAVSESDDGSTVTVTQNDVLVVRLPAQLGTGFSWGPAELGPMRLLSEKTETKSGTSPGSAELQVFTLMPAGLGTGRLQFVYRQPWLREKPARTFTLDISSR